MLMRCLDSLSLQPMTFPSWIFSHLYLQKYFPGSCQVKCMCSYPPPVRQYEQAEMVSESCLTRRPFPKQAVTLRLPKKVFSLLQTLQYSTQTPDPARLGLLFPLSGSCADAPWGNVGHGPPFLSGIQAPQGGELGTTAFIPNPTSLF